ncbi:MAG: hypothetical protein PF518_00865 [Spirochaetaceae bacterium]|jgi:hypothetical protein|nr:hypothetical protein [Spirochaetaceae bacterium]
MNKKILFLILLSILSSSIFSENINGYFQGTLSLSEKNSIAMALEEIISINFDTETSFLEGIEIKIEVPKELQIYRNSFALYVYKGITPEPDESVKFYKGSRIFMRLLPVQNNIYIKIPAMEENSLVQSADTILIPGFTPREDYPLMATIIPIMKGIPGTVFDYNFQITCKPIYSPKGSLILNITSSEEMEKDNYSVVIDGDKVKWPSENFILDEGLHEIQISSSSGMTKNASIVINAGEKKTIDMHFEYTEPEITIEAPEGAMIILDDVELIRKNSVDPISLEVGEHTIIFDIGGYQFSREFAVEPGDSLTISLVLDVLIHKN